jgi:peptidylprolyl isomerase
MTQAKSGDKVKVHYQGRLTDGSTFDSSEGRDPLAFEVGAGMVIKGFDEGVTGMNVGEKKTVHIPFVEAYGPRSEEMFIKFPKEQFPADMNPEIGLQLTLSNGAGEYFQVRVAEIMENEVILDGNHPLAGQDLVFDIELVEIEGGSPLIIMP